MSILKKISTENIPLGISAVVFDFDGVFTGNKVILDQYGVESIECWRGDGIGIELLKKINIPTFILSHEKNTAALSRAKKLGININVTSHDKNDFLKYWVKKNKINPELVIFLGNDVNDISAMEYVGIPVAVNDAHSRLKLHCKYETVANGGMGAVREVCELVYQRLIGN